MFKNWWRPRKHTLENVTDQSLASTNLRGYYAGFITRLISLIIDLVIIVVGALLFNLTLRLVLNFFGLSDLAVAVFDRTGASTESYSGWLVTLLRWVTTVLTSATFLFIYLVFFWTVTGKTPGKAILGLRVVQEHEANVSFKWAVVRAVGYYVSLLPLGLGFFWILIDDQRRGWHDKMAHTYVLYDWDARLGRRLLDRLRRWRLRDVPELITDAMTGADESATE